MTKKYSKDSPEVAEVAERLKSGEEAMLLALKKATRKMAELTKKLNTADARYEAVKYHAVYAGMGTEFMDSVVPEANRMPKELEKLGLNKNEAQILTGVWLGKVMKELYKQVYEMDERGEL